MDAEDLDRIDWIGLWILEFRKERLRDRLLGLSLLGIRYCGDPWGVMIAVSVL